MKVLVLNSGSSSLKFQLFRIEDWAVVASGQVSRIGEVTGTFHYRWLSATGEQCIETEQHAIANHHIGLEQIVTRLQSSGALTDIQELCAVGHRVVHGGEAFHIPTIIDDAVIDAIRQMIPLAPLHNPANLDGILIARALFPQVPQVAVFDTAFHQTMPRPAYHYALPATLYNEHHIRRYGFHGTSHHYVAKRAALLLNKPLDQCNLITLHLGNGCSATAIQQGRSVDTSMGMTPLEGLVMGTRCGDLDPAILLYLTQHLGLDHHQLDALLNRQSGLFGLCGVNDMRELHRLIAQDHNQDAELALNVFCYRLKKYVGAYYAVLGQLDAIVFTGGIGENDADVRTHTLNGLNNFGIILNETANYAPNSGERVVSHATSPIAVLVIPTNEELEIAQQTLAAV
ncbi:acetate/propionate family kinase [Thiospirillum jenense]|uniref:Acetate kinase n=1 Tax=Thiospirillum jenense TaxID=1653858 RepID=A0A839HCW3_9GAMM|nr:acetate kinase [Thiospirillum jenense]MBB1126354.1 acetate kinase [Thiospirillum jenense]